MRERQSAVAGPIARSAEGRRRHWLYQLGFVAAHVPLALLIPRYSPWATLHARSAIVVGVLFALLSRRWERTACVAAYIAGAEVFWRMRRADIPWEGSKYAIALILLIAVARFGRRPRSLLPAAYFLLLLPSVLLTVDALNPVEAREQLSFDLSGPLALFASALFFCSLRFSRAELRWVYVCLVAPIVSVGVVGVVTLQRYMPTEFGTGSNPLTSGGFGPNQVSAILGLGIVAVFLYLVIGSGNPVATAAFVALGLFFFRQCAITFSRGGLYMAVGSIVAAAFYLAGNRKTRWRLVGLMAVILPILFFLIWPRLETLTGGAIGERFSSTESTGRDLLIQADLKTWFENPLLGTGPGLAAKNRLEVFRVSTSHTEYSRMVSEHGLLGFLSLIALVAMAFSNLRVAPTRLAKALAAAVLVYSMLSMAVDGMRLGSAGFVFGLSGARPLLPRRQSVVSPIRKERLAAEA